MIRPLLAAALVLAPAAALAKESLGVFGQWGAFRDVAAGRCYAIAKPSRGAGSAAVGVWPDRGVRGQVHLPPVAPRRIAGRDAVARDRKRSGSISSVRGRNAWTANRRADAAAIAAMRSEGSMRVMARGANGRRFTDRYLLDGVATAIDAARVGCAELD